MSKPLLPPGVHKLEHVNLRNAKVFSNGRHPASIKAGAVHLDLEGWTLYAPGAEPERLDDYYREHWTITDSWGPAPWSMHNVPPFGGLEFKNVKVDARGGSADMNSEEILLIAGISHLVNRLKELRAKR